jgi:4-hydroxy-tetrahydrodipicolinate synthase
MFKGSFVALITPFKNGKVDDKKLKELVEWHIAEGTNGLVPVGTTGESTTLSHGEHEHVIDVVVKAARKRVPVMAGAGSNSTDEAIALTQGAKKLGADGVLSVNPYYNKPTQEGLLAHFTAIAKSTNIPIVLYNIPSRTVVKLETDTLEKLVTANKNIVGIKDATGSLIQATELVKRFGSSFCIMSGEDSQTLSLMELGGTGVISVAANIVPKDVARLCEAALEKKMAEAQEIQDKMNPLIQALFLETNPAPIKTAMLELGLIEDEALRLPLVNVRPENRQKIKAAIKAYGIKVPSGVK